ncbi:MAG: M28 family peptidase [Gemmatimonadaceae bacterium]
MTKSTSRITTKRMGGVVGLATCLLLLASCRGDRQQSAGKFDGQAAIGYAKAQLDFGPRVPGTPAAQRAGDWIIQQMKQRADTVIVQSWTHVTQDGKSLPMRNIIARFKPASSEHILYVTHWDTRPTSDQAENLGDRQLPMPGANDGASGVGLFIALGDALKKNPPAEGVDLLFVDGEDYGAFDEKLADVLIGSAYFAAHPVDPGYKPLFGVLWDMIGDSDLRIMKEPISMDAAPEVVDRVWQTAKDLGHGDVFLPEQNSGVTDDHVPLIKAGMRVIDVIDIDYPYHHRPTDTLDKISAKSLSIVGDVAEALLR